MSPSSLLFEERLASLWAPRDRRDPLEWSEKEITLDPRFTPRPGRYDSSFTPYIRQLHRWYGDRKIRQITLCKAAQIAGTTWLANCLMWSVAEDPGPILYVTSTADNAKSWSERELIPRLRSCSAIRPLIPEDPDKFKKCEMAFSTCTVKLVGSNSEANLASRPTRILLADEVDKWPDQSATEAPALELAMARTNFYHKIAKILLASTPTVETGAIWQQFLKGSQHRYNVECPDCKTFQWLKFDQLLWSPDLRDTNGVWNLDGVAESAVYLCESCGSPWSQSMKASLLVPDDLGGRATWIQGNSGAPSDHISAHVSALYSPQISWGELAKVFIQKSSSPGGLHDFRNTFEGLPYENRLVSISEDSLLDLRSQDYELLELPAGSCDAGDSPVLLSICADPGQRETHWSVEARNSDGESWVVDYGTVLAIEDLINPLFLAERVYSLRGSEYEHAPMCGLIDSGDFTERVYSVCDMSGGLFFPSKGSQAGFGTFSKSKIPGFPRIVLYTYIDFTWKTHLYAERIGKKLPPLFHLPRNVGRDFLHGHSGQRLLNNKNSRLTPTYWAKVPHDHWGDCSKMHQVIWAIMKEEL